MPSAPIAIPSRSSLRPAVVLAATASAATSDASVRSFSPLEALMRRSFLFGTAALAGALALGCAEPQSPTVPSDSPPPFGRPSLAVTTEHIIGRTPIEFSFVSACTGELVNVTGVISGSLNVVSEPGNDNHFSEDLIFRATGVGETTGATYIIREHHHGSFNTPTGTAPNGTITDHDVAVTITHGSLANEFLHFDLHFVFTGKGELLVTVDNFTSECRA